MDQLEPTQWYFEVSPPRSLAHLVACLWEMRVPTTAETRVRILPNACVDIVLYAGETSYGEGIAGIVAPPHCSFVVGSTLRSFIVRSAGSRHILGASLLPAGVQSILGVPARIIGDRITLLDDVIGSRAAETEDAVLSTSRDRALARLGEALVRLHSSRDVHSVVAHAVARVRISGGQKRLDTLATATNLSIRQLERVFREHVGFSPKTYSRLVRFDRAVRAIEARGASSWTHFALAHGYSDQAHFINEFKEFAGVTPAQFERELATGQLHST